MFKTTVQKAFYISIALILTACQTPSPTTPKISTALNTGPVTIEGDCEQRAMDGYRDKIKISVKDNVVSALDWTASPRAGSCRFELKNFTQVATRPSTDLQSKKDKKCHLYVWQDNSHVTISMYGCKRICKQNDRILPVLLDLKTGQCKAAEGYATQINKTQ